MAGDVWPGAQVEETIDPEQAIDRALENLSSIFRRVARTKRLFAIRIRNELTEEKCGAKGKEYAASTMRSSRAGYDAAV